MVINKQLKDNTHLMDNLKPKAEKLRTHVKYILAKHLSINRIHFGNTLWHKVILPSLSHAAGTWFNETEKSKFFLRSCQYQMGKAILRLNCMPAMNAINGDLGWMPIADHLDTLRISYYAHLLDMQNDRLPKRIMVWMFWSCTLLSLSQ